MTRNNKILDITEELPELINATLNEPKDLEHISNLKKYINEISPEFEGIMNYDNFVIDSPLNKGNSNTLLKSSSSVDSLEKFTYPRFPGALKIGFINPSSVDFFFKSQSTDITTILSFLGIKDFKVNEKGIMTINLLLEGAGEIPVNLPIKFQVELLPKGQTTPYERGSIKIEFSFEKVSNVLELIGCLKLFKSLILLDPDPNFPFIKFFDKLNLINIVLIEENLIFWEALYAIEQALNISFNPFIIPSEQDLEDLLFIYNSLIRNKGHVVDPNTDHIIFLDVQEDQVAYLTNRVMNIKKDNNLYQEKVYFNIMGAKFELFMNLKASNIEPIDTVYNKDSKELYFYYYTLPMQDGLLQVKLEKGPHIVSPLTK